LRRRDRKKSKWRLKGHGVSHSRESQIVCFADNKDGGLVTYPGWSHEEIERRAYHSWEARGRPFGSPEVDWFNAEQEFAAVEPEGVLSKVAREVGSALGGAVALLSELNPMKGES
jgi:hypothetical protein